jgi:hypothetical protein
VDFISGAWKNILLMLPNPDWNIISEFCEFSNLIIKSALAIKVENLSKRYRAKGWMQELIIDESSQLQELS